MKYMVIGGAGYIGSHFVARATQEGHVCLVYDNLSTGHKESIPATIAFVHGDLLDRELLKQTLNRFQPDGVLHYAACALVGESVMKPDLYYNNNVYGVMTLLEAMRESGQIKPLVFSSSCAVFGNPVKVPIAEDDPKTPISPYGRSKLMAEYVIEDYSRAFGFKTMALRYFNACGAHHEGLIGEDHVPETHLIPNLIKAATEEQTFTLFGKDYPTPDGTCIRDYVHVTDLAISHLAALDYLQHSESSPFAALHLGTGQGYSNLEVLAMVERVLQKKIIYQVCERRAGDADALYADNQKAGKLLGFHPQYSDLETIVRSAAKWHIQCPRGYSKK